MLSLTEIHIILILVNYVSRLFKSLVKLVAFSHFQDKQPINTWAHTVESPSFTSRIEMCNAYQSIKKSKFFIKNEIKFMEL